MGNLNKEKAKEIFTKAITGQVIPSSSLEAETDAGQVLRVDCFPGVSKVCCRENLSKYIKEKDLRSHWSLRFRGANST